MAKHKVAFTGGKILIIDKITIKKEVQSVINAFRKVIVSLTADYKQTDIAEHWLYSEVRGKTPINCNGRKDRSRVRAFDNPTLSSDRRKQVKYLCLC